MKYLLNRISFMLMILISSGNVFSDCNEKNQSNFKKIVQRATNNALPAAGLYYQKNNCIIQLAEGYSNLATKIKIQNNARFDIGSITKTFVAVTSVKLAKAGAFSLDDTLQQWLPTEITDHIPESNVITIRQLLSHTSGIADFLEDEFILDSGQPWTELDVLRYVFDLPLLSEPGTQYYYSNTNYVLMGLIINEATNKPFATNIRELIIEPLGLNDTFHLSEKNHYLEYVHGYGALEGVVELLDTHDIVKTTPFADGQMISSLHDLAIFIQAIFTNKTFMDDALLETLLTSPVVDSHYKLGIVTALINDKAFYSHGGFEPGYSTQLRYSPITKETIVFFVTGTSLSHESNMKVGEDDMTVFSGAYEYELQRAFRISTKIQSGTD
ncbi:MAG: serine hydrolase domain-containing protein [Thiohalomonadales bacterium]